MNERNSRILSQVRTNLGLLSKTEIRNKVIFNKAYLVQNEILLNTKCVELDLKITLVKGKEDYPIWNQKVQDIEHWFTSWNKKLTQVSKEEYLDNETTGSDYPLIFTSYANKLWFRPIPTISELYTVTFWGRQISTINKMDDEIPPEIPDWVDDCFIDGICSKFNPKEFLDSYLAKRDGIETQVNRILSGNKQKASNW